MNISYWIILFSVSCFANILGLNISSGFNSVITIYILIPLLIIPQLILSGVVVDFDKLNESFSNQKKVPFIGELMASRWAYEAIAVTQYRDNPYKKNFYSLDRTIAQNTYKSIYYIKTLSDKLAFCNANPDDPSVEEKLNLVRNEIKKELAVFGSEKFPNVDKLTKNQFSDNVFEEGKAFLNALRGVYNNRRSVAKNKANNMVRNIATKKRIVVSNGELVQKIYPIYARNTTPNHLFDFRVNFYYPEKYFAGMYIDTKIFNTLVIWSMTIFLFIALYYDWLRKILGSRD
jgi:hypothetical protein